ncbi:MAG TPA: cation-translocating P-type ATPase, partial [Planctomycetota bacterium]|nr:cation-translocating P-type ATPase [Planctomycetota bacterium]
GVILAIVVLNAAVGFYQEYRAERSLLALKKLAAPRARVVRGGASSAVAGADLVPGDLVELEPGDVVPADARITFAASLRTDESALTGESTPVEKTSAPTRGQHVSLGDRASCAYVGTTVVGGRGRALVFGTGPDTELGKIAALVRSTEREATPLQKDLAQVAKILLLVCSTAIVAVFAMGVLRGIGAKEMFLTAVSLAVAAIPEGLPAIVTITLAIGVQRMLKRHVLLRRLTSVETLGSASVVCADKTGTITRNEMTVRRLLVGHDREVELGDSESDERARELLGASAACSNVRGDAGSDPTELALVAAARRAGWSHASIDEAYPRVGEAPFDSQRRRMSTLHAHGASRVLFVKGAHEVVLERCARVRSANGAVALDARMRGGLEESCRRLADGGMRVLAVASREVANHAASTNTEALEEDLTLLGLVAMADVPRPEVRTAVGHCRDAGIATVLVTGDHVGTATAIAREVGIFGEGDRAVTGSELAAMGDDELRRDVERIRVYARLAPEQKLKIVNAWKHAGAVVAMTGDGVNDAPAIRAADVGVAMGQKGTDVAREAADLVVTDDNFASIVAAVEEGRAVHSNIRKALLCLFAGNLSEVALVGAATAFGLPVPLNPTQILWMNLVTDGPPALALATEPPSPDEMRRPPRSRFARILDDRTVFTTVWQGFALYLGAMLALLYFYEGGAASSARMQTGVFCTVVVSQMLNCFSFRHEERSILQVGVRGNLRLLVAVVLSIAFQVAIVQWDVPRAVFHTVRLTGQDWSAVVVFSLIPVALVEIGKALRRRRRRA